jgi:alpha-tubulin suppressor-like RCC1 family protein
MTIAQYGAFVASVTTPTDMSGGGDSMCVVVTAGLVKCSGRNDQGQLGNGTTTSEPDGSWVVVQNLRGAAAVDQAGDHGCALRLDTSVACWGADDHGQLGDGATTGPRLAPVNVVALAGVTNIAAAPGRTCAIVTNQMVNCWGSGFGPLPVAIPGLTGVTSLAVGVDSACAVTGGAVECWGANDSGQLGNGTTTASATPIAVAGLPSAATQVVMGDEFACAQLADHTARCWGADQSGQLGPNATGNSSTPVNPGFAGQVEFPNNDAVDMLFARGSTVCAFVDNDFPTMIDQVSCWGANFTAIGQPTYRKYPHLLAIRNAGVTVLDLNDRT